MLQPIENYYLMQEEPARGVLLALRDMILKSDKNISEAWKYGMPFFCYSGKMCCYLWTHKKFKQPYIGFVEGEKLKHPQLLKEKRARMKILLLDPFEDIPVKTLQDILSQMIGLYK